MYPTARTWKAIANAYGEHISAGQRLIMALFSGATMPFALLEQVLYPHATDEPLTHDPLFIVGHWRSGTTHLHRLLAQDEQWATLKATEAYMPHFFLVTEPIVRGLATVFAPKTRGIDNMATDLETAEDETAIARLSFHSYSTYWLFPAIASFKAHVGLEGLTDDEIAQWKATYDNLLRKKAARDGRRLLSKNPAHTARIEHLRAMYPNSQFITIHRHPYEVFASMRAYFASTDKMDGHLVPPAEGQLDDIVLDGMDYLFSAYFKQRDGGDVVEVRYDDLVDEPLEVLRCIYEELGLDGYAEALPAFTRYLSTIAGYQRNTHTALSTDTKQRICKRLGYVFNEWGYEMAHT